MKLFSKIENSKDVPNKEYVDEFYKKPANGIPKSDLASAVQTSLGKADAAVPNTRKVNNKALSSDITLSASDVGALPDTTVIPTKVSDLTNDSGFTSNTGTVTSVSVKMNGTNKGTVTSSGTIDLGTVITDVSGKLDKTQYEVNKTIDFGASGALYIGKFNVYDTNITCEITSTTSVTYSGKLVIATQNYVIKEMTVYGDAANTVAPNFYIRPSSSKSDPYVEVYFKPTAWSKNVVHIYGSAIAAEPTNVCTSVSAVPSTATAKPTNALDKKANLDTENTFTQNNTFKSVTIGAPQGGGGGLNVIQGDGATGDVLFTVDMNGIDLDPDGHRIPLLINGSTGMSGQALTAQSDGTPSWEYVSKYGYTTLTNDDLNTITEPGRYNAAVGNSCTNKPSAIGTLSFYLTVEGVSGAIRQTLYQPSWVDRWYVRYYSGGWTGWNLQHSVNTSTQVFSGSKTFGNGINLTGALQVGGSPGAAGQVLTSTGTGTPQWKTPGSSNVETGNPEVNGVSYTVFDSGEFGSFIGVFYTEAPSTGLQITVGRAVYTISSNEQSVSYRLTIDKGEYNVYSTIAVSGGTVDKSSDFGLIPTGGAVSISTNLESSYVESNTCVIIRG